MSSMCLAVLANSSLTSSPLWPYFLNLNGDGKAAPVRRSVRRFAVGSGLPAYFAERRLRVERIDLARPAVGEDVDDALGLGREVRLLGRERVGRGDWRGGEQAGFAHELREAEQTHADAAAGQHFATGQGELRFGNMGSLPMEIGLLLAGLPGGGLRLLPAGLQRCRRTRHVRGWRGLS